MKRACLSLAILAGVCLAAEEAGVEYSDPAPLASRSLLLDIARAGPRVVAVGERGHVLLSDDEGVSWRQVRVPTRAMLTGVYFIDARHGWAVGHDEVILCTEDGGESWERTHHAPENEQPLLDVWFRDADYGLAVGAYGLLLRSEDGGRSWQRLTFDPQGGSAADDEEGLVTAADRHLNKLARAADGTLYLAAEAGYLFRSDDDGLTWTVLPSPYAGSFFGVLPMEGQSILVFGLRGRLFRSQDGGRSWTAIPTDTTAMLTDAVRPDEQTIVISGLAGALLVSHDAGRTFQHRQQPDRRGIQALLIAGPDRLLAAGEGGVRILTP